MPCSAASLSIRRPSMADGREIMQVDIKWDGNKLRLETSLADFSRLITGGDSTETKIVRWRQNGQILPPSEPPTTTES